MAACEYDYGSQDYWENLYATRYAGKNFDWYQDFDILGPYLKPHLRKEDSLLVIGCGNSQLSSQLYSDGFEHITNVDYSPTVIEFMAKQCAGLANMKWLVMDATKMSFADNTWDSAVDKGTLDSIMCRADSHELAPVFFDEVHRVLKPGAKFVVVSFDKDRAHFAAVEDWDVQLACIEFFDKFHGTANTHWVYTFTKKALAP